MTNQVYYLRFEKADGVYNATIKNYTLPVARHAFIKKLREMGVLNVDLDRSGKVIKQKGQFKFWHRLLLSRYHRPI